MFVRSTTTIAALAAIFGCMNLGASDARQGTTIECDLRTGPPDANSACHVSVHQNDIVTFKVASTMVPHESVTDAATAYFCADKFPGVDVAFDVNCSKTIQTCEDLFTACTTDGTNKDATGTGGLQLTFGTPGDKSISGYARYQDSADSPTFQVMLDLKQLSLTEQDSAFSAAYTATTFVASSMLVAGLALF